jgi:hypothetical protein
VFRIYTTKVAWAAGFNQAENNGDFIGVFPVSLKKIMVCHSAIGKQGK